MVNVDKYASPMDPVGMSLGYPFAWSSTSPSNHLQDGPRVQPVKKTLLKRPEKKMDFPGFKEPYGPSHTIYSWYLEDHPIE